MSKSYKQKFKEAVRTATDLEAADMEEISPWLKNLKEGDQEFYYQFMLEYYFDGGKEREFSLMKSKALTRNRNARNVDLLVSGVVHKPGYEVADEKEFEKLTSSQDGETTIKQQEEIQEERIRNIIHEKG